MNTQLSRPITASTGLVGIPAGAIERRILFMRGHTVMVDSDLAKLYGVTTKALNQAVKRNLDRFPSDFMFQLTQEEQKALRSQIVTLKEGRRGSLNGGRHSKLSFARSFASAKC